jgi:hypothetical protein
MGRSAVIADNGGVGTLPTIYRPLPSGGRFFWSSELSGVRPPWLHGHDAGAPEAEQVKSSMISVRYVAR